MAARPRLTLYKSVAFSGGQATVSFDHAAGLNVSAGGAPTHFTIAGADQLFHPATAQIVGQTVVVQSPQVPAPAAVRFAYGSTDEPNLVNGAGLPASSFRTDSWPWATAGKNY